MQKLRAVEREGLKTDIPAFAPGDTLRVMVRVREGEKERLQAFEGICIARRGGGINETFTVRKISAGVGVERRSEERRVGKEWRCRWSPEDINKKEMDAVYVDAAWSRSHT